MRYTIFYIFPIDHPVPSIECRMIFFATFLRVALYLKGNNARTGFR